MIGLGLDLCTISRMEKILTEQPRFVQRYFTQEEREYLDTRGAGRFQSAAALTAAKEAFLKALGAGIGDGIALNEICVKHLDSGAPVYAPVGEALARMRAAGAAHAFLSLTHEGDTAAAVCILE